VYEIFVIFHIFQLMYLETNDPKSVQICTFLGLWILATNYKK